MKKGSARSDLKFSTRGKKGKGHNVRANSAQRVKGTYQNRFPNGEKGGRGRERRRTQRRVEHEGSVTSLKSIQWRGCTAAVDKEGVRGISRVVEN